MTLHKRACAKAIRLASQHGNQIHEAELAESPDRLYPVRICIKAIDRYHLLSDLIECITERLKLSMTGLSTETVDNIGTCTIDFSVHSADELQFVMKSIKEIERDTDRDNWLDADAAMEYGLIDKVIDKRI